MCFAAVAACGAGDWKRRLQERFEAHSVEHPLMDRARQAHKRALQTAQAERTETAKLWALAADRFLSAALVQVKNATLQTQVTNDREKRAALLQEVEALEHTIATRFSDQQAKTRKEWIDEAKEQAYAHAEEYEAKRFRSRNQDGTRLKIARDELVTLARLQLEGARALSPEGSFDVLAQELHRCGEAGEHLKSLDCVNKVRWRIQEVFTEARQRYGLDANDTFRIQKFLASEHVTSRWQNDSLALVDKGLTIAKLRAAVEQIKGPIQLHGPKAMLGQLRRRLRAAGVTDDRLAEPIADDGEFAVAYLLAYPRPVAPQRTPGSR